MAAKALAAVGRTEGRSMLATPMAAQSVLDREYLEIRASCSKWLRRSTVSIAAAVSRPTSGRMTAHPPGTESSAGRNGRPGRADSTDLLPVLRR